MTNRLLLTYHSDEGQTAKVAGHITATLRNLGATVEVATAEDDPSPAGFDAVIVGDSIHMGKHSRSLRRWLTSHADDLDEIPVALFQVSLTSATHDDEHDAEANRLVQQLLDATGLDPDIVGLFAGALAYTRYGWLKRSLMRRIAAAQGDDTDATRDHEYTDWEAVEQFAVDAMGLVESEG